MKPDQNHQVVLQLLQFPPGFSHPIFSFFLSANEKLREENGN